jgi:DNA-binding beta-propeller fold protein YncE
MLAGICIRLRNLKGNISKLDPQTGSVLADYFIPGSSLHDDLPFDQPTGLAWDGTHLYLGTRNPNFLRTLSIGVPPNVTVDRIDSLSSLGPGLGWPMDLAYADGSLYYPSYLGGILEIDPATATVLAEIPSPSPFIYGLTFDGQHLLAAYGPGGLGSGVIWVLSPTDGSILDTWNTGINSIVGLAYDRSSQTLYIGGGGGITVASQVREPPSLVLSAPAILLVLAVTARRENR